MMLGECDRCDLRTPELSEDLVVIGWVEAHVDVAGSLLIQEVVASKEDPGIRPRTTSCTVAIGCLELMSL